MKTQTRILDNRLYYTRKIELHRKGKKSHTVHITLILICLCGSEISLLITVRRVHYGKMGKATTTLIQVYITAHRQRNNLQSSIKESYYKIVCHTLHKNIDFLLYVFLCILKALLNERATDLTRIKFLYMIQQI